MNLYFRSFLTCTALSLFFLLGAQHAAAQSATFIDVTDPPGDLTAVNPTDTLDDKPAVQAIIDYVETSGQQAVLFFPPAKVTGEVRGYLFSSKLSIGPIDGLRILGGGHAQSDNTGGSHNAFTKFVWTGGTTGPAFEFSDVDGLVVEGISFQSNEPALDVLVKHKNTVAGGSSLDLKFEDCGFHNAQILFYNGDTEGDVGTANIFFDNCMFDGEHDSSVRARYAFYNHHPQGLIFTFQNCYYVDCGTIFYFHQGGRLSVTGGGVSQCAQLIHKENGGQNTSGFSVRDLFIDGNGTERLVLLSTSPTLGGKTYGPFVFENINYATNYPSQGANFAEVSSWAGTTVTLGGLVDLRPGDTMKFYDENDHDVVLAETTVVTRNSFGGGSAVYTVTDTCCELAGLPADVTTVDAAQGDALFKLYGGEEVTVRNCLFNNEVIRGERLLRLKTSTFDTGRVPVIVFEQCRGFEGVTTASELFTTYVEQIDTPSYYRFRDCGAVRGTVEPLSTTNIP